MSDAVIEQQFNSDLQVKDKVHKKLSKKSFLDTKKENQNVKHCNSEQNLFRIRKKYFFKQISLEKVSNLSKKVLEETNINSKKNKKLIVAREFDKIKSEARSNKEDNVAVKQQNQKRKINLEENSERRKAQKVSKNLAKLQSCENMYEYRHQLTSVSKNEGDSNFLAKNDVNEENLINVFYQQQCLGGSNNSIATLCNIGNSCYLNSVIYTLRFAPQFLHKLHHLVEDMRQVYQKIGQHKLKSSSLGRNVSGLQNNNGRSWSSKDLVSLNGVNSNGIDPVSKSNRQIATEKLHELYQSLHRNESIDTVESFHAGTFLQAIQDVSSVFEGNQQQDVHELLMCILDSLRETCSTLIKTIKENPEIMNQSLQTAESSELTSPPQSNVHSAQSLKSIFSRKIRRKDTIKNNGGISSPIKENVADTVMEEEPTNVEANTAKLDGEVPSADSDDKINEAIKRLGLDFFCEDFEGITLFTTKCLTCETVTEQKETMVDIAIPMSHDSLTQPIDPQLFFQVINYSKFIFVIERAFSFQSSCITREYFRVENHFRCDKCCGYTEAIRSISFEVLPRLLVLHIKRFSGGMEKISSYSPTPFILKCFCNKCYKKRDEEKLHYYKLYSVITHVGATMSAGHYIAYTCSLDIFNEYTNCCYGKRKLSVQSNNSHTATSQQSSTGGSGSEKNSGLMKKLIYGRSKASSSGDMSKSLKPINGLSKLMINGIERLSLNSDKSNGSGSNGVSSVPSSPPKTVCPSSNCCGIYVKNFSTIVENYHNSNVSSQQPEKSTSNDESVQADSENTTNASSKPSINDLNQKIWYMCDDDKIKIMTQREFEEALSRNQKVMITPYLLFYARYKAESNTNT